MASKENFRNKNTEKKYFKVDLGESGSNCVNWTEIKDNELWFLHCTHPCQCNSVFLWNTDSVMTYIGNVLAFEIPDVILSHKCHFMKL